MKENIQARSIFCLEHASGRSESMLGNDLRGGHPVLHWKFLKQIQSVKIIIIERSGTEIECTAIWNVSRAVSSQCEHVEPKWAPIHFPWKLERTWQDRTTHSGLLRNMIWWLTLLVDNHMINCTNLPEKQADSELIEYKQLHKNHRKF